MVRLANALPGSSADAARNEYKRATMAIRPIFEVISRTSPRLQKEVAAWSRQHPDEVAAAIPTPT
jgi:hypothetical protein